MQYIFIYIYIFTYLYICTYLYISKYFNICILKKRMQHSAFFWKEQTFSHSFTFFAKERKVLSVLLRPLQKNVEFSAFFYVLKKRTQKNASSFGSHKSPKTRKKNVKELRSLKECKRWCVQNGKECGAQP